MVLIFELKKIQTAVGAASQQPVKSLKCGSALQSLQRLGKQSKLRVRCGRYSPTNSKIACSLYVCLEEWCLEWAQRSRSTSMKINAIWHKLQRNSTQCSALQCTVKFFPNSTMLHTITHCNVLQQKARHYSTLQRTATV